MSGNLDETDKASLNFNADGLIPVIAQDTKNGAVLMFAWANEEALKKTLSTGEAHYWSRSRGELWHKGATSGGIQKVRDILVDCDQDCLIYRIEQAGTGACHTGRPTCFYRTLDKDGEKLTFLPE